MRTSRSEYNHEQMISKLLTRSNVDFTEKLRMSKLRKRENLLSDNTEKEKEMARLKTTLIKEKYADMNLMSAAPSKSLAQSLAALKQRSNDNKGHMEFYKGKGINQKTSRQMSTRNLGLDSAQNSESRSKSPLAVNTAIFDLGAVGDKIRIEDAERPGETATATPIGSSGSKITATLEAVKSKRENALDATIKRGLDKIRRQKKLQQQQNEYRKMRASSTSLWSMLEADMVLQGNHLDPFKAVMHSRQIIQQASSSNVGKINYEKLLKFQAEKTPPAHLALLNAKPTPRAGHIVKTP